MERELIDGERIFAIRNFFSPDECRAHIQRSESLGFEIFQVDGQPVPGYRDNFRVMIDDEPLAESLWQRAASVLPSTRDGAAAVGLNPRFRYYRYRGNESFAPHFDGSVRLGTRVSKLTFLVYLNDVASGGETRFYDANVRVQFAIPPEAGKAVVFEHDVLHEGLAVTDGTKYVLRSDVLFAIAE